jgi:hypothetical protein
LIAAVRLQRIWIVQQTACDGSTSMHTFNPVSRRHGEVWQNKRTRPVVRIWAESWLQEDELTELEANSGAENRLLKKLLFDAERSQIVTV